MNQRDLLKNSRLLKHTKNELALAGLLDTEEGQCVVELVETIVKYEIASNLLAKEMTLRRFLRLARYKNLTPLTDNPDEWIDRSEESGYPLWQNKRNPKVFSKNRGKDYIEDTDEFDLEELEE